MAKRLREAESLVLTWIELAQEIEPPDRITATEWHKKIRGFRTVLRDALLLSGNSQVGAAAREFEARTTIAIDTAQGAVSTFVVFLDGVIPDPYNARSYAAFVGERELLRQHVRDALEKLHGSLQSISIGRSQ
ncbi:hypothetical protein ACIQPR_44890 [Streptomyces sp. NPDC091280]|uniref:hypothetical protein n=1 Tax=Streptomyces sp. NPDC091280 TaxID=3365984 RepID=UPI0038284F9E